MALTERICAICNKEIEGGDAPVVCVRCHSLYHKECWDTVDRCVVYGCNENKESYGLVDTNDAEITCESCHAKNPRSVQFCLHCGQAVGTEIERQIFVSAAGWRATTPEELITKLSQHWESGIRHLYGGDVEHWLKAHGHQDWADKATEVRKNQKQRSIGLETFIQGTGVLEKPVISVNPKRLIVEGSAHVIETVLDVNNGGRGYLFGRIKANVPWVKLSQDEFVGNYNRIEITVQMEQIPEESASGLITLSGVGDTVEVEIKATRIGVETALKSFNAGDITKTRALCRRLADAQAVTADVATLLAACYISENNDSGAASVLGKLTGACSKVDNDIIKQVYTWMHGESSFADSFDRFPVLEAFVSTADGELASQIKAELAKLALEKVADLGSSVSTGSNLWKGGEDISQNVNELLQMAVELDPSVSQDASQMRKHFSGDVRKGHAGKYAWNFVVLLLLVGIGSGLWWGWRSQQGSEFRPIAKALQSKDFAAAEREVRILCDNDPDEATYYKYYFQVLEARAQDEIAQKNWAGLQQTLNQISGIVNEHFTMGSAAATVMANIAKALEDAGNLETARICYELASQYNSQDTQVQVAKARLAAQTDTFWKVYELSMGELGTSVCSSTSTNEALKPALALLDSLGVTAHDEQLMLAMCDIDGDGSRELVVCGSDKEGPAKILAGKVSVYKVAGNTLNKLYEEKISDSPFLLDIKPFNFSGTEREDVAITWTDRVDHNKRSVMLLADKDGNFVSERVPGVGVVEFADHNGDKRTEVWVAESPVKGGDPLKGVHIFAPMLWTEPGFINASGNFDKHYNVCIEDLERELKSNPYVKGGDEYLNYEQERQQALNVLRSRLTGNQSAPASR